MENKEIEIVEIYPTVLIYKNLFKDISKSYGVLIESLEEKENRLFSNWRKWFKYGIFLNPLIPSLLDKEIDLDSIETKTNIEENQKQFAIEMLKNFYLVTKDYTKRYNVDIDINKTCIDEFENVIPLWKHTDAAVGRYDINVDNEKNPMHYHIDYAREKKDIVGYSLVITCIMYFNDDYEGGEIEFLIKDKKIKYKPQAGDILMMPSGHPDYLIKEKEHFLHRVMPIYNKNRFVGRLCWEKYENERSK
jgi:hypothetical protein